MRRRSAQAPIQSREGHRAVSSALYHTLMLVRVSLNGTAGIIGLYHQAWPRFLLNNTSMLSFSLSLCLFFSYVFFLFYECFCHILIAVKDRVRGTKHWNYMLLWKSQAELRTQALVVHAGLPSSQGPALKVSVEKSAVAGVGAGSTFPHDLAFLSRSFCFSTHLLCSVCSVF